MTTSSCQKEPALCLSVLYFRIASGVYCYLVNIYKIHHPGKGSLQMQWYQIMSLLYASNIVFYLVHIILETIM